MMTVVIWQKNKQVYGNIIIWTTKNKVVLHSDWLTDKGVFVKWQHSLSEWRDEELIVLSADSFGLFACGLFLHIVSWIDNLDPFLEMRGW